MVWRRLTLDIMKGIIKIIEQSPHKYSDQVGHNFLVCLQYNICAHT